MDPASLDPRLRDAGEDSIVVHDEAQLSAASSDVSESPSPQQQQQRHQQHPQHQHQHHHPSQTPSLNPLSASNDTPNAAGDAPLDPNDPKRPRACEACRGLKVKCEPDPANPDGPCKRCTKAGRNCVVTQPTRKRQKKTDSRVAELEKKIDALTASLQATRDGSAHATPSDDQNAYGNTSYASSSRDWGPPPPPPRDSQPPYAPEPDKPSFHATLVAAGHKRKFNETRESSSDGAKESPGTQPSTIGRQQTDAIDRGIITVDDAARLFRRYTDEMAIHLPAVVFPRGSTFSDLRKSKPILFLTVMAVAASETPVVQRQLVRELMQIFAEKIVITGEKNLEMVQALLVSVIWYFPPEHFEELKFYSFIHMAAIMSIDIGLGRKKNNPKSRLIPYTWRDHPFRKTPLPDPTTIEARRTWLASYFLAANVAMALHRPNLIRWQAFMSECMEILETSPEAAPTDRYLCHLVWTHRLAEEVGIQFSMDDPSIFVNITEQTVQYALRGFERDLAKYRADIPKEDRQPSVILSFHVLNLYMHEIALYVDKNSDEYRAPINAEALHDPIPGLGDNLTAAHIGALSSCLTAIDGIFETFLAMDTQVIRCLPIFNFVRVAYAVVVLIKMYFSASSPNSELGKVINKDNMKVSEYLDKLLEKFRDTAASDKSRPAGKFLVVLMMLRGWFHKKGQARTQGSEQVDPALHISPGNNGAFRPKGQDSVPASQQQDPRQQQYQQQSLQHSDFNPANTPLQLLSEIATGNGPSRNDQNAVPRTTDANSSAYQSWSQTTSQPYMYDPTPGVTATGAEAVAGMPGLGQGAMPMMDATFGGEIDFNSMGDGFEQAMGLTLNGFGGGGPGESYESMRLMMQQQDALLTGMFEDFPSGAPNLFGF
ncbi:Uu.00g044630.m01.CDS01 [Anthostomella pinea]|uniref:Uu.00g044630.m01.CDS01 n=1 Tax=Anthostomella pinea TaxID=933095 RepID=A0AAI8VBY4_9PEZI|nr:Uu.00g044630.m01.CDS01 [Anthostomella pinea]